MFFVVVPPAVSARPDFTYAADKERGGDADPFWSCTRPQKGEKACPPVSYKVRSIHGCRLLHTCFEKAVVRFAIERRPDTPAARSAHRSPDGRRAASAPCPSAGGRSCLSCPFNACAVSTAAAPTRPGRASPTSAAATPGPSSVTCRDSSPTWASRRKGPFPRSGLEAPAAQPRSLHHRGHRYVPSLPPGRRRRSAAPFTSSAATAPSGCSTTDSRTNAAPGGDDGMGGWVRMGGMGALVFRPLASILPDSGQFGPLEITGWQ